MSAKKSAPTDEELSAMFEGLGGDDDDTAAPSSPHATATTNSDSPKRTPSSTVADADEDPLAELASLAAAPRPSQALSRPATPAQRTASPRVDSPQPRTGSARTGRSPKRAVSGVRSGRTSEEKTSERSSRDRRDVQREQAQPAAAAPASGGGGWWGGLSAMASAAVKQAEAAVKEIQRNEEAQKWAEQVKGNVGALRGLGMDEMLCDLMRVRRLTEVYYR